MTHGTLADTLPVCIGAFRATFQEFTGKIFTDQEIFSMFGKSEEGMIRDIIPQNDRVALTHWLNGYETLHQSVTSTFPGIFPALDLLQQANIKLAIVTGKGINSARISMRRLGLDRYFKVFEIGSPDGPNKTDAIQKVLSQWNLAPYQVGYVGDAPGDMEAAFQAGVIPIGAAWAATTTIDPKNPGYAQIVFNSTLDLISWIKAEFAIEN